MEASVEELVKEIGPVSPDSTLYEKRIRTSTIFIGSSCWSTNTVVGAPSRTAAWQDTRHSICRERVSATTRLESLTSKPLFDNKDMRGNILQSNFLQTSFLRSACGYSWSNNIKIACYNLTSRRSESFLHRLCAGKRPFPKV